MTLHLYPVERNGMAGAPWRVVVKEDIEVTLSMIVAGETELDDFEPGFESPSDAVRRIYRAMEQARRDEDKNRVRDKR